MLQVKMFKKNPAENFSNLDMITKLLNKKQKSKNERMKKKFPKIEVLSETVNEEEERCEQGEYEKQGEKEKQEEQESQANKNEQLQNNHDKAVEQLGIQLNSLKLNSSQYSYGFNNNYEHIFEDLQEELYEICQLNPDAVPAKERTTIRD